METLPTPIPAPHQWDLAATTLYQSSTGSDGGLDAYSRAEATIRGYLSDWTQFSTWSNHRGIPIPGSEMTTVILPRMIPVDLVKQYIEERAGELKHATILRHLSAIKWAHFENSLPSPTDYPDVKRKVSGLVRRHSYQPDRAKPLFLADLRAGLPQVGATKGIRDRALMLLGWWAALRRSELVAIDKAHLSDHPEGLLLTIPKSKTDQTGEGRQVALHYREDPEICPVRNLRAWLELVDGPGAVFRYVDRWGNVGANRLSGQSVSLIVKGACQRIGLDPRDYSAHSLRSGFVSECDRRHIPSAAVRAVTRHTTDAMLNVYERPGRLFSDSAGAFFEDV